MAIRRNQTPTFPARIMHPSGDIISPDYISSITYTINRVQRGALGQSLTGVTGHVDVSVPLTALLEFPVADSFWDGMQTGNDWTSPSGVYSGVRIVILESDCAGEFEVDVYYCGVRISEQTTSDSGIGADLTSVTCGDYMLAFNQERSASLIEGIYDVTGGNSTTSGTAHCHSQLLASASSVGEWANFAQSVRSAFVRGYNFKHTPNTRTVPAFVDLGFYEVQYRLLPIVGNPIILPYFFEVTS